MLIKEIGRGFVGAVSNYKGGVGKTVASVSLATSLARQGRRVLLIDIDPQSDSSRAIMQQRYVHNTIYDLLDTDAEKKPPVEECIYPSIQSNLDILPNIPDTSGLEIPLSILFPESNFTLRNVVYDHAVTNYDYTLIDCPPTLSIFVSNALYCADFVLIPMMAGSGNSLEGIRGVLDLMASVKKSGNPDLQFLKILVNKLDRRKIAHKANLEHAKMRFGEDNIFRTVIPTNSDFETLEAMQGATIFSRAPRSRGAAAFKDLSHEFLDFFDDQRKKTLNSQLPTVKTCGLVKAPR